MDVKIIELLERAFSGCMEQYQEDVKRQAEIRRRKRKWKSIVLGVIIILILAAIVIVVL